MLRKYVPICLISESDDPPIESANTTLHSVIEETSTEMQENFNSKVVSEMVADTVAAHHPEKDSVIDRFFSSADIHVIEKCTPDYDDIIYLVNAIVDSLPLCEDFLHTLRKANCTSNGHFDYSLNKMSIEKRTAILKLVNTMRNCGIFSEMLISTWNITGNVSSASRVRNFLSGVWLELYSQQVAVNVVKKFAEEHHLPYEVYCNLQVEDCQGTKHEIDLMFSVGEDKVFGAEMKSGLNFFDFDKYRLTAEWMQLIPDRFLLLSSNLTDENEVKCISYFYRYFICGISSYEATIKTMLTKAFED